MAKNQCVSFSSILLSKLRQENPQRFRHHRRVQRPQITGNPKESVPKNLAPVSCFRDSPWHKVQEESTSSEANPRTPSFSNGANRHRQTRHQDSGAFVENHRTRPTRHTETVREAPPIFTESRLLHQIHLSSFLYTGSPIPAKLRQKNPQRFRHHWRVQRPQISGNPKESVPKNLTPVSCFRDSPRYKVREESTPSEANPRTPSFSNGGNHHRQTRHQDSGAFVENHRTSPTRHTETFREAPPIFTESQVDVYAVIILFVAGGRERRGGGRERRGGGHGACGDREADEEAGLRRLVLSSSTDNTSCVSLDSAQPSSTQTVVPSTDTRSPLSTDNTHLPSSNILHPTSIDTPSQTSIDTEPRDMVAPDTCTRQQWRPG
ncbi:hypothetical protein F2Q69_00012841 [Brassica cretica]|uniref:Uncharacterized protein n=1 Tax=Brassica cretica TaxID=69181 RepID=A0A8S9R1J9_BRACR|nr:hypothetical protein F2Q69_00012841 [Brassica cretica]